MIKLPVELSTEKEAHIKALYDSGDILAAQREIYTELCRREEENRMSEVLPEVTPREPISLDKYLRQELAEGKIDFAIRAAETEDGHVYFYIHPHGKNGDTRDFYLNDQDQVIPIAAPGPLKPVVAIGGDATGNGSLGVTEAAAD